jgi:glycyl-tRNA synthetase
MSEESAPATTEAILDIDALNAQITKQASLVRQLKKDGASATDIADAVSALTNLKIQASNAVSTNTTTDTNNNSTATKKSFFQRKVFEDVMLRKMFIVPAFEIHGGVKGLYDLGPPACALKVC